MGLRTKTWPLAISGYPLLPPPAQAHVICTKALRPLPGDLTLRHVFVLC